MRLKGLFVIFVGLCIILPSGSVVAGKLSKDDFYNQVELLTDAISLIQANYVEDVNSKDLIYGALKGLLSSLDAHSQFMDPELYKELEVETTGWFGGVGIEITIKDNLLTIISPIEDTPAWEGGIKGGDRIIAIDGESTKDIDISEAAKKLRGEAGTKVHLTIMREKEKRLFDVEITRAIIEIESIKRSEIIDAKIGYIKLIRFMKDTAGELEDALTELEKEGMDALILDLRNNPGGLLKAAVEVADKFIDTGKIIVSTQGKRSGQTMKFKSKLKNTHPRYPLVVLVNYGCASASEIVAGAVQDNKRGIILGERTFGKASVQTVIPMKDGSAIRLTTAKYFTPSGKSIHDEGIIPDIRVEYKRYEEKEGEPTLAEKFFEKIKNEKEEDKEEKEDIHDNQILAAIDVLKGIKVYKGLQ